MHTRVYLASLKGVACLGGGRLMADDAKLRMEARRAAGLTTPKNDGVIDRTQR